MKSVRLSDDVFDLIERQAGDTFTAKFESLLTRAFLELPAAQAELDRVHTQIAFQRERLRDLTRLYRDLSSLYYDLNSKSKSVCSSLDAVLSRFDDS